LPEKSKRQKAKLPKFEQSNFYFLRLSSLNTELCMENLCAVELSCSRLRPYFVSSPLNNLSGCTGCSKVSCR
jgi:hypothetical protein